MRISDWSSDVCSSDLMIMAVGEDVFRSLSEIAAPPPVVPPAVEPSSEIVALFVIGIPIPPLPATFAAQYPRPEDRALAKRLWPAPEGGDRKSDEQGKRVALRVDIGGRRVVNKK